MIHLDDNLRDVIGYKQNMISGKNAGTVSGMNRVIFVIIHPVSPWTLIYFLMGLLLKHQELVIQIFPPTCS
jgi:hypothetical protein